MLKSFLGVMLMGPPAEPEFVHAEIRDGEATVGTRTGRSIRTTTSPNGNSNSAGRWPSAFAETMASTIRSLCDTGGNSNSPCAGR
jgi:hypothetical protein